MGARLALVVVRENARDILPQVHDPACEGHVGQQAVYDTVLQVDAIAMDVENWRSTVFLELTDTHLMDQVANLTWWGVTMGCGSQRS